MRLLAVVAALVTAALVVLLLQQMGAGRGAADREGAVESEARGERVAAPEDSATEPAQSRPRDRAPSRRQLRYADGAPAGQVFVNLAVGRPVQTRIYRNGDYPSKTIWLVSQHRIAAVDADGMFTFPRLEVPAGSSMILYTDGKSSAHLLEQIQPHVQEVRAVRKSTVGGILRDAEGNILADYYLTAQRGWPEDWDTRYRKENDSFLTAAGDLEIDPDAKAEATTGRDGRFWIQLVPGRNTLMFGEWRKDGTMPIDVPARDLNLGDVRIPPRAEAKSVAPSAVHGMVLDCAGNPQHGVEIRLWAGNVGEPSHQGVTDKRGRFRISGIESTRAILWAVSSYDSRLVLPSQCSGTVHLPCNTPIVLRAPAPDEYLWVELRGLAGQFLFIREEVFLGYEYYDGRELISMPPGAYRIILLTREARVLEAAVQARPGEEIVLTPDRFHEVAWD